MSEGLITLAASDGVALPDSGAPSALSIRGLTVSYGDTPAVFSVDADFPQAKMSAIIGPNGAGKSTLLKASMGILPRLSGEVSLFGDSFANQRDKVAYVPQRASVDWDFPTTVAEVVSMGLYRKTGLLGRFTPKLREQVRSCLDRVGMADFAHRQIGQLSGGQQQRVFLARALAQDADLYLLDEPFTGVDAATERAIMSVLDELKSDGKSVVAVHHDLNTIPDYFDHVFMINIRRIAEGPVETHFTADNLHAAYGGRLASTQIQDFATVG
ncbi:MAG: metal ABC transporter ATP-binding protein [Pseudomonadota bacterium]